MSGTIGEDTAIEALKNGATDYVLKHRPLRLIPAVDRALREIAERKERERAEEAMRQSEHKYRKLFESLTDAAFLADEQTGKIIDTNPRAEELLGCNRGEILGRKQSEFLALDKIETEGGLFDASTPSQIIAEGRMIRPDGKGIPIVAHTSQLTLYGHPLVLWLCPDHSTTDKSAAINQLDFLTPLLL
ncbi:MAG: PAS domain S-box protein [Limisphaerales bacterium]